MRVAIRGLWGRKLRTVLTALSIVLGTAMIAGTFVVRDQITNAFSDIFDQSNKGIDVVLSKKTAFTSDNGAQAGPLPASVIDQARSVDGVAKAEGQVQALGSIVVNGSYVSSTGGAPNLVLSYVDKPFSNSEFTSGGPPTSGTIAINKKLADDKDIGVGDKVGLATETGVVPVTVSGIFTLANVSSIGGATVVVPTFEDAQKWFDRVDKTSVVYLEAASGVSPGELKTRVQAAMPSDVKVQTGAENAKEQTDQVAGGINGFLTPLLLAFAGAAVFVGAFIIFNTFSITVAQRTREFAMLRTIGASRRQVLRSVLAEAVIMGVVASLIGILVGVLFAKGLNAGFEALGFGLPTAPIEIAPRTILIPLAVGTLIALLASIGPAVRATRVPPIAALREGAELPRSRFARFTPIIAGLLLLAGLGLILNGVFGGGGTSQVLLSMAVGAVLCFIAVAMLSKYIVRPAAQVLGWPLEKLARGTGRLARENTMRNPGRTAVTAAALMIGVGLVVFVAVFVNGFKESFLGAIDRSITSDLIIQSESFSPIPRQAVTAASGVPGVNTATGIQFTDAKINKGGVDTVNGVDPSTFANVYRFDWLKGGSNELLQNLGPSQALIEEQFAKSHNLEPGDSFTITSVDGHNLKLTVAGEYKDPVLMTGFIIPTQTFDKFSPGNIDPGVVLVEFDNTAQGEQAKAAVTQALKSFPSAKVRTNAEYKANTEDQVNQFLALLYVLLAMSVIISLFGIVNTLALSVFERTREIGMLRAIGMTRRQLRRVIRWEAVITAIIGGILGIIVGVIFGWIVTLGLADQGVSFAVPYAQLLVCLIVAAFAGMLAAILPARRAAKLNVLEALQYE